MKNKSRVIKASAAVLDEPRKMDLFDQKGNKTATITFEDSELADNFINCRATAGLPIESPKDWVAGQPVKFGFIPMGVRTINAHFRQNDSITITVEVDEQSADEIQACFDDVCATEEHDPFADSDHKAGNGDTAATLIFPRGGVKFYPGEIKGKQVIIAEGQYPTGLGATWVNDRTMSSWSPEFGTDADFDSAKAVRKGNKRHYTFPDGVRGSASNPARVNKLHRIVGAITNMPAFGNAMPPVKAKKADADPEVISASGTSEGAKKGWENRNRGENFHDEGTVSVGGKTHHVTVEHPDAVAERQVIVPHPMRQQLDAAKKAGKLVRVHTLHAPFGSYIMHLETSEHDIHAKDSTSPNTVKAHWHIEKRGDKWHVIKADGKDEGASDSEAMAKKHLAALYANSPDTKASLAEAASNVIKVASLTGDEQVEWLKAHEADKITMSDLHNQLQKLVEDDERFQHKGEKEPNKLYSGPRALDVIRDEDNDAWSVAVVCPCGTIYEVPFEIDEDNGAPELDDSPLDELKEVQKRGGYVETMEAGHFMVNGNVVKCTWSDAARLAALEARRQHEHAQLNQDAWKASEEAMKDSIVAHDTNSHEHHTRAMHSHRRAKEFHAQAGNVKQSNLHDHHESTHRMLADTLKERTFEPAMAYDASLAEAYTVKAAGTSEGARKGWEHRSAGAMSMEAFRLGELADTSGDSIDHQLASQAHFEAANKHSTKASEHGIAAYAANNRKDWSVSVEKRDKHRKKEDQHHEEGMRHKRLSFGHAKASLSLIDDLTSDRAAIKAFADQCPEVQAARAKANEKPPQVIEAIRASLQEDKDFAHRLANGKQSAIEYISDSIKASLGGYLVKKDGKDHLPTTVNGKPDKRHMGAAWASLHGGYRGNKYEGPDKEKAIARLKKMYKEMGEEPPGE